MACKDARNYTIVDDKSSLEEAIFELKEKSRHDVYNHSYLAVDCEGVSLSRKGALTIVTTATEEKVYIFDVLKLGQALFSGGLREILEDKSCEKLMFDCREDSDGLWHQFNVQLMGVLDVQLLEVIYRRENDPTMNQPSTKRFKRRSQRTDEVERIYGFRRCLELYVQDEELVKIKGKGKELFKRDEKMWEKRPLSDELIHYCVVDTMALFKLYDKMKDVNGGEHTRLRVASEKYADMYRWKTERSFDDYEMNAYLPLDIIPEKGTLGFPQANTVCTRCNRLFPRDEFSLTQLRTGEQKCRVCKEIKRLKDVEDNRSDNRARKEWRSFMYDYYFGERSDSEDYYYDDSDEDSHFP